MKKILYGVCGIGSGHTHRQLPLIEHFSKSCTLVIFAYGYSYDFYSKKFNGSNTVSIIPVAVPFYICNEMGVDFEATAQLPQNKGVDFEGINKSAKEEAFKILGKPDLVITDYEPVSAEYAYAHSVSLITIDQQSKYLCGHFPGNFSNLSYKDEVARLGYFFPRADARIACSFFQVSQRANCNYTVKIYPPVLKDEVIKINRKPADKTSVLVYISTARSFPQTPEEILRICSKQKNVQFHIFLGEGEILNPNRFTNIKVYQHGDPQFYKLLQDCSGIVSTAGHSLLSEAMYLGIPVYAIPIGPYEQHMNAFIINRYDFGISNPKLDEQKLSHFIKNIPQFQSAIHNDTEVLMRGIGQEKIIRFLKDIKQRS